jgi:hypothetical protein
MAASAAHAARTVRHSDNSGSFVAFAAVARRGFGVVFSLAIIRVSFGPSCGQSRVEVAPSIRLAFKVKPNYDEVNKGFA